MNKKTMNYVLNEKQKEELRRRGIYGNYQYSMFPKPIGGQSYNRYSFYAPKKNTPRPYKVKK